MSFFVKEYFNLNNGVFQPSIDTETSGNGTIFQDGSAGYVKTYANADAGIMVSAESLTQKEFFDKPFKISISYELTSLQASDVFRVFTLVPNATQPAIDDVGTFTICVNLFNDAGTYKERWTYFDIDDNQFSWNEGGSAWAGGSAEVVREINLNETYTIEIIWHPETQTFSFDNGTQTATTTMVSRTGDPWWWYLGFHVTTNHYGQSKINYLYVEDISWRKSWKWPNSICTAQRYRNLFGGHFLTILNNLTTQQRERHIFKNNIYDYQPSRKRHTWVNSISQVVSRQDIPEVKIYLDDYNISKGVESWSMSYQEDWYCKQVKIKLRDGAVIGGARPYLPDHDDYLETRIDIYVDDEQIFEGFFEDFGEDTESNEITGRSYTALGDRPFSEKISDSIDTATTKKDFADALVSDLTVNWNILNTIIPANYYNYDDKVPIDIIKDMVESCGGVLVTDKDENLIAEYRKYKKLDVETPTTTLSSSEIIKASYQRVIPTGENSVIIMGSAQSKIYGEWPSINIIASKDHLRSDGNDSLTLTVWCRNGDGTYQDVETVTDEEVTCSTDPYKLSLSKTIQSVIGVWVDNGGAHGAVVDGPYTWDGSTLTTTGMMTRDEDYLVSYVGGLTCSISVDQLAEVDDTSLLIENGFVETILRASAGGGGIITVTASWTDGGGATATETEIIFLDDARVGAIDAAANPSSLERTEESVITARVYDSKGETVPDGFEVEFELLEGAVGTLSDTTANTTTSTIENETHISSSQSDLSTRFPIDTLTSIYRYYIQDGEEIPYTDVNYADYATVSGSTITLSGTVLPEAQNPVMITYDTGGAAQVTYTAPSSVVAGGTPVMISCKAGAENKIVTIELQSPQPSDTSYTGGGRTFAKKELHFEGTFTGKWGNGDGFEYQDYTKLIPKKDGYVVKVYEEINQMTGAQAMYVKGVDHYTGDNDVFVVLRVVAHREQRILGAAGGDGFIGGRCWVKTADTDLPVQGATVGFFWTGEETASEVCTSDSDGKVSFAFGKTGTHKVQVVPPTNMTGKYDTLETNFTITEDVLENKMTGEWWEYFPVSFSVRVLWRYVRTTG